MARAIHRRNSIEAQTPLLFDNTPSQHDGYRFHVEREKAPAVSEEASASIPPTSQASTTAAGAEEQDREASRAGERIVSGVEVAEKTTVPSSGACPSAAPRRVCACGCGSDLGPVDGDENGRARLVCRGFWFSLPQELRRIVYQGREHERVAACKLVLKMAIQHRRALVLDPATAGRTQREVAPQGEPEGGAVMPCLPHAPVTPAAGERPFTAAPVPAASENAQSSDVAADIPARAVEVDRDSGQLEVEFDEIQPDPDAPLPAYRPQHVTQRAGAATVAPFCEGLRAQILEFIQGRGERGATNEEISDETKIKLQTVCGRVNELQGDERRGLPVLVICGGYRPTRSGSRAKVWVAV